MHAYDFAAELDKCFYVNVMSFKLKYFFFFFKTSVLLFLVNVCHFSIIIIIIIGTI